MTSMGTFGFTETIRISTPEELSEAIIGANSNDTPVVPFGGGTMLSTGNPVSENLTGLDLQGMSGIVDYVPTDMTAGFLAGTSLAEVKAALASNGQELPIDLAEEDSGTIGGLVATGFSGPRRFGQGTLKDLLIGCEYVRGDGLIAKAGGMTVKNVSGFEISRLLHGSWGSLAVLTRVNLKVLPLARVDSTFTWIDRDHEEAMKRQSRLHVAFPAAIAVQTRQHDSEWKTSIRFTGRESAVADYDRLITEQEGTPESGSPDEWVADLATTEAPQLVLHAPVGQMSELVAKLVGTEGVSSVNASLGTGSIRACLDPAVISADQLEFESGIQWMVEGGFASWKSDISVWGPAHEAREVMRAIKQQFDPANVLNRGRLFI